MAANDMKEALKGAAESVRKFISDIGELKVETRVIEPGQKESELAASTVIRFDGDNTSVVPATRNGAGRWEVDATLYDLHTKNLQSAIEYRSRMIESLLGLFR